MINVECICIYSVNVHTYLLYIESLNFCIWKVVNGTLRKKYQKIKKNIYLMGINNII